MADKITRFEDYKKKDNKDNTEEINIQIEDPLNFFNEQEKEEYFQEKQKGHLDAAPATEREEKPDDYDEEEAYEEEQDEGKSGFPIEFFIKISSIITGIVILVFLAMVAKVKIYDKYFAKDPDEVQTVVSALPAGFVEKNDNVTVTAQSLNLRTVASSESDATVVTAVPQGTVLKRIAVNEEGTWALVEYNGAQVYASMKYLSTP